MIREISRAEVPRTRSERTSRSIETDGSPASIFATRDWLDLSALASATWVRRRCRRRCLRPCARRSLRSIYVSSSSDSLRNSLAVPTFHPLASSRRLFSSRILIVLEPSFAGLDHSLGRCRRLLREYLQDHDRIRSYVVDDPPGRVHVVNAQLVATSANRGHRARMRHTQQLATLQSAQQVARPDPARLGEGRRLNLSVQPDEMFVGQ